MTVAIVAAAREGRSADIAIFSDDDVYRWWLTRELGGDRTLVAIGLNPSTATAEINDPTIRKDIGFAQRWGCGRIVKGNAYGYRATDPENMKRARKAGVDVVGFDNDRYLMDMITAANHGGGIVLVAWGNHIEPARQRHVASMIDHVGVVPMCLGTNKNGTPKHECYLGYDTPLVPWSPP